VRDAALLNGFKEDMARLNLRSVSSSSDVALAVAANQGTALMLNDATFISAATRLQESLSLLRGFLPLLAAALAAIGYFVSYLMIQTRSEEYAVFRLLGLGKGKSMALYFAEIAALTLGGSLIGVLISAAAGIGGIGVGAQVFLLFSVCFSLGGAIALWRLGRTNVMLALTQN
jgi:ABC-type antimicrobial peptide transport system permease subunit